jgi:Immunity protein Imm1
MFIARFSVEDWINNQNQFCVKPANFWSEIELAIRSLDGQTKTLVTLETESESHMSIGGGQGKYVVYATFDNEIFYSLIDPSKSDQDESAVVVGGQKGLYPAKSCVNLEIVLQSAQKFAESGEMLKSAVWEEDKVAEMA